MTAPAVGLILAGLLGCSGSPKYVPVSGVVTLNGKPYAKAVVSFQPIGTPEHPNPGVGSSAYSDENGRFELMTGEGVKGAVVGPHRVRIQTRRTFIGGSDDPKTPSPDNVVIPKTEVDPIPLEWYSSDSKKTFTVPPGGTDQANFDIQTKKK
jgi:hypothetical protein